MNKSEGANPGRSDYKSPKGQFAFEVNPLVLQIVLCNESEILDCRSDLALLGHPCRVAEICKELFFRDVAEVLFKPTPVWVPTSSIERDCGGSYICAPSRYELKAPVLAEETSTFRKIVRRQFRRRLKLIVQECVMEFESYNLGLTSIDGLDDSGRLSWRIADAETMPQKTKRLFN